MAERAPGVPQDLPVKPVRIFGLKLPGHARRAAMARASRSNRSLNYLAET